MNNACTSTMVLSNAWLMLSPMSPSFMLTHSNNDFSYLSPFPTVCVYIFNESFIPPINFLHSSHLTPTQFITQF